MLEAHPFRLILGLEKTELIGNSPLVAELDSFISLVPYQDLLRKIQADRTRAFSPLGRPGYHLEAMLRAILASYFLPSKSTADMVRRLQEDPILAITCGFDPRSIPHRSTFSRFNKRLVKYQALLDECINKQASLLKEELPGYGDHIAIDSTPVRSHSNPDKKRVSDNQAGWVVKGSSGKKRDWYFGYKLHLIVDTKYELPIGKELTLAKMSDNTEMLPLMVKTKDELPWSRPKVVIADKGYDASYNYQGIVEGFHAIPIIPIARKSKKPIPDIKGTAEQPYCPMDLPLVYRSFDKKKGRQYRCPARAIGFKCDISDQCGLRAIWIKDSFDYRRFGYMINRNDDEWGEYYDERTSIERVFSRLKQTRRLERHCFRRYDMVNLHATLSVLVMQAIALAKAKAGQTCDLRECVRQVG